MFACTHLPISRFTATYYPLSFVASVRPQYSRRGIVINRLAATTTITYLRLAVCLMKENVTMFPREWREERLREGLGVVVFSSFLLSEEPLFFLISFLYML